MARYLYDYGLPFSETLDENISDVVERVKNRFASLIIVDGGIGKGKTTLCCHIADRINALHDFPRIKFEEQLAVGGSDFLKKLRICYDNKLPCLIYSEAGDFNRRGSLTRFNAMLTRTFETFRAFKIIVILDLPNFSVLDQGLFDNNIPRLLVHVEDRNMEYGNFSGYSLYRMLYIKKKMEKLTVKAFAYTQVTPNFRGHFLNYEPQREKALDTFTIKGKLKVLKSAEIKMEGLISYTELAKKLNRSVIWVRKTIAALKIKHKRIIDRAKYFDEAVVNTLSDYLDGLKKD